MNATRHPFADPCPGRRVLFLVCAALAGCGVTEYDRQMANEQERLQAMEDEARYLDKESLKWPPAFLEARAASGEVPQVTLRPPKGIALTAEDKPTGVLAQYQGSTGNFQALYLAAKNQKRDEFLREVMQALGGQPASSLQAVAKQPFGQEPIPFDAYPPIERGGGKVVHHVYFHSRGNLQVAIVFVVDKNRTAKDVEAPMDYCLKSLWVRPGVAKKKE